MDVVKNIGSSIKSGWTGLSKGKKIGLVTVLTLLTLVGAGLSFVMQKTEYTLLFADIEEADAGNIVNDLEAQGIRYQLKDGGTTIYIDEKYVDKYRIELAVNDMLPSQSVGFEIFDNTSMMATDEDREIMRQRAVQGELERSIQALSGVESVKVILSLPQQSVFTRPDELEEATASVMLTTSYGHTLSSRAVEGIASLVSGAVDRLPKQNISIIDQHGNLLSAFIQADTNLQTADLASHNREIEENYARTLEQKLLKTLVPIYGAQNLSISVNVTMDFEMQEEEKISYEDPEIRSQEITASGGEIVAEDGSSLSGHDVSISEILEGENGNAASYHITTNNELGSTVTRTVRETGEVSKITASILYNNAVAGTGIQEAELEEIIQGVLGLDNVNEIKVLGVNFNLPSVDETPTPGAIGDGDALAAIWDEYGMIIIAAGGILIVAILTGTIIQSRRRKRREAEEYEEVEPISQTLEEKIAEVKEANNLQELLQNEKVQKELSTMKHAKDNPELVADLIKMWMKDE